MLGGLEIAPPSEEQKESCELMEPIHTQPLSEPLTTPSVGASRMSRSLKEEKDLRVCSPEPPVTRAVRAVISGALISSESAPKTVRATLQCSETLLLDNEIPVRVKRQKASENRSVLRILEPSGAEQPRA